MNLKDHKIETISESEFISRDLSWLRFNYRVLDQTEHDRTIFDRLKFLAITASNLDEFCTIRLGSLYNYLDYAKERFDYNGMREVPFRNLLLREIGRFIERQNQVFIEKLRPEFSDNGFEIVSYNLLSPQDAKCADQYFINTIFPMLTPMVFDGYHAFPVLKNNRLLFGVVTGIAQEEGEQRRISFIQVPGNLPRFFEIPDARECRFFVPIEEIIRHNIHYLFRNVEVLSVTLFRVNRNGDFTLEESEDIESNFLEELKRKLQTRRTGRVVRIDMEENADPWVLNLLKTQWDIDDKNIFTIPPRSLIDLSSINQIVNYKDFKDRKQHSPAPIRPLSLSEEEAANKNWFEVLKKHDVLLHHPYNEMSPVLQMLEQAAEDPKVLSIKITIYRLAKESRVSAALLRAAEMGKHVSVLFEVKARFDEENNLREAQRLQKAGCFVIYGMNSLKTHTKLLLIVRAEGERVYRYVHLASGNYNESTSRYYTDLGLLTTKETYANDVSDFFNVITGHSQPSAYRNLITSPIHMRLQLVSLVNQEAENASMGLPAGIVVKVNSLQDKDFIEALYKASQAGVNITLIVRGICCLRPGRKGLSETIKVISIVGEYLEHSRIYYFHNEGRPKIYIGSADAMVRSFDRRIESLFCLEDQALTEEVITILKFTMHDNVNAYVMNEDGSYEAKVEPGSAPFNIHEEFFNVTPESIRGISLF